MCLLLFIHEKTFSQSYIYDYKRILVTPFIADNDVTSIAEDSNGFIWLSTVNHVYRFDGYSMEQVKIPENSLKKSDIAISKLVVYKDCIYVLSNWGIHAIQAARAEILQVKNIINSSGQIFSIEANPKDGVFWMSSKGGFYHLENDKLKFLQLPFEQSNEKCSIGFQGDNVLVSTGGSDLFIVDIKSFLLIETVKLGSKKPIIQMISNPQGVVLISEDNKTFEYNKQNKIPIHTKNYGERPFDIAFFNNDIFTINNENQLYHHYFLDGKTSKTLIGLGADKAERIHKIYLIQNKIFAATTNGLIVVSFKKNNFNLIYSTFDQTKNSFDVPRGIAEDENYYYLTTYNSIIRYHKKLKVFQSYFNKNLLSHAVLRQKDSLWIATDGNGLRKYVLNKNYIINGNFIPNEQYKHLICIANLSPGRILIGGYDYLILFDQNQNKYREIVLDYEKSDLSKNMISQIYVVDAHHFYLATTLGVLFVDDAGRILKKYGSGLRDKKSLQSHAMWVDKDRSVWAGTSNGVFHFSPNGKVIKHLTRENGLSGDRIASLVADNNNHLWVATFTGLSSVDLSSGVINNYKKEDGLPENEFNHASYLLTQEGKIILGTMNGFVLFEPEILNKNKNILTTLSISKVEYGNIKEHKSLLNYKDIKYETLRLGKGINYVKIQFNLNPLDIFQKTNYDYKIEGIHNDWINIGATPILHIDNFKPGKYVIQVRARTGFGSKQIISKSMPLIVEEYFYKSDGFYILVMVIFIVFIILYSTLLIRRNMKIIQIRQQIAQDLHDEVGSYLTGISMSLDMMQRNKGKENVYYESIKNLGKKALKSLKDSIWSLDNRSDNALQLWDRVKSLASETYAPLDINFSFNEIDGLEKIELTILEKTYLFYAIKECITNSIKHGDRKMVKFSWEKKNDCHFISVANSYDSSMKNEKNGHGLYNIENRMKKIKAEVLFQDDGQLFTVHFKLKNLP